MGPVAKFTLEAAVSGVVCAQLIRHVHAQVGLKGVLVSLAAVTLLKCIHDIAKARSLQKTQETCERRSFKVAICGAGASGVCMAIKLQEAGIPFVIFDYTDAFGGTWLKNSYPGAACDILSVVYSYSFAQNPTWSRLWSSQKEILAYFQGVANSFGLEKHTRFRTKVRKAKYIGSKKNPESVWRVELEELDTGKVYIESFSAYVSAVGQLDRPKIHDFPGLDTFEGPQFHTSSWDHSVSLKGKNMLGIGTGASAVQVFPAIAPQLNKLSIIQRSPIWVATRPDRAIPAYMMTLYSYFPFFQKFQRTISFFRNEIFFYTFYNGTDFANRGNKLFQKYCIAHIKKGLSEHFNELEEKVVPSYPIGCKRAVLSNDWMPMLARDNVDLHTSPIKQFHPHGVELEDGSKLDLDVVVHATGFHTTDFLSNKDIVGLNGVLLQEEWNGVPHAYKSVTVPGFPNFFMLYGPSSNLGHNSVIFMIERQAEYVAVLLKHIVAKDCFMIDVKREEYKENFKENQDRVKKSVYSSSCTSWYKTDKGEIVNNWGGSCIEFYLKLRNLDINKYNIE